MNIKFLANANSVCKDSVLSTRRMGGMQDMEISAGSQSPGMQDMQGADWICREQRELVAKVRRNGDGTRV